MDTKMKKVTNFTNNQRKANKNIFLFSCQMGKYIIQC